MFSITSSGFLGAARCQAPSYRLQSTEQLGADKFSHKVASFSESLLDSKVERSRKRRCTHAAWPRNACLLAGARIPRPCWSLEMLLVFSQSRGMRSYTPGLVRKREDARYARTDRLLVARQPIKSSVLESIEVRFAFNFNYSRWNDPMTRRGSFSLSPENRARCLERGLRARMEVIRRLELFKERN